MLRTDADLIKYGKFAVAELSPWYQPRTLEGIASDLSRTEARIASTSARIARIEAWLSGLPDEHKSKLDAIRFVWQWRERLSDLRYHARILREEMEGPLPTAQEMAIRQYIDERLASIHKAYCFDRPKDGKAFADGVRLQIETLEDPDDLRCEYWREEHEAAKEEAERSWLDGNPCSEEIQRKLDLTQGAMVIEEEMLAEWLSLNSRFSLHLITLVHEADATQRGRMDPATVEAIEILEHAKFPKLSGIPFDWSEIPSKDEDKREKQEQEAFATIARKLLAINRDSGRILSSYHIENLLKWLKRKERRPLCDSDIRSIVSREEDKHRPCIETIGREQSHYCEGKSLPTIDDFKAPFIASWLKWLEWFAPEFIARLEKASDSNADEDKTAFEHHAVLWTHKATNAWRLLGEDEAKMILHAKAYDEANAAKQASASQDLYHVPGMVEGIMRLTLESAAYPSRELAFCGAIALVSLLTGRKVTLWGKYTNVYLIGIASSATGKDIPRKVNKKLLKDLGMGDCLNESLASGEGLEDAMIENPLCLLQVDETDHLIRAMAGARESRFASISERLLTMFTSSDGDFYCRVKAGIRRSIISRPHLVLFGTCTPKAFWESLGEDMLSNGLFARMLTVEVERRSDRQKPKGIDPDPALLEELAYWRDFDAGKMASDAEAGNLAGVLSEVYEIPADEDAIAPLTQALDRFDAEYRQCETNRDEAGKSIWGRAGEYSLKLAAIYACSIASGKPPRITSDAVRWATRFMEHHTAKMLESAKDRVAQTDFAKNAAKVLDRIKAKRSGISHSALLKASHLVSREFNEIIKTLMESGEIELIMIDGKRHYILAPRR